MSTLTFNGTDLADFGVHISGEGTYNAPSRAVEEQIVPGRNGTLIIDGGRWENIIVTYPAYITDDFDDNMAALRSFLASVRGYARLADTYHPNEFRLACFSDEITVRTSGRYNAQGQFDLSFNCKPQRFLTSGEEVTTFDASNLPSESFSGNPATFETDGEYKVSELSVGITPVQSGSGDPSPSNVRAISGRTGLTVTRCGKNLLDDSIKTPNSAHTSVTFGQTAGYSNPSYFMKAGTYTFSVTFKNGASAAGYMKKNGDSGNTLLWSSGGHSATFTLAEDVLCSFWLFNSDGIEAANVSAQIEAGTSATAYEPYTAQTYPVTWETEAGTVYGGTLDVVSGALTVNRFFKAFDGTEDWARTGSIGANTNRYYIQWVNMGITGNVINLSDSMCSHLVFLSGNVGQFGTFNASTTNFAVKDGNGTQFADMAAFKAWLAAQNTNGTPLQLCVELATPQTFNITPISGIKTLLGGNTIYTDAGGVDGKYLRPLRITNPTAFEAKPIIRIYGAGTVGIGDVNVTFDGSSEYVDLDCEIQDAYYGLANKNSAVTLDPNRFPVIPANGAEIVLGSGVTQVDITPRWFEL